MLEGTGMRLLPGRFYFSRQHGAYITLACSWLLSVVLSSRFSISQILVLLFLMAGLNSGELIAATIKRKTPLPPEKRKWLGIYLLVSAIMFALIIPVIESKLFLVFPFVLVCLIYVVLVANDLQKHAVAEWIVFLLFSLSGLLAFQSHAVIELEYLYKLAFTMTLFFGTSIFTVKARFTRMPLIAGMIYVMFSFTCLYFFYGVDCLFVSMVCLFLLKFLPVWFAGKWFGKLKIPLIGAMEAIGQILFVLIMGDCYPKI